MMVIYGGDGGGDSGVVGNDVYVVVVVVRWGDNGDVVVMVMWMIGLMVCGDGWWSCGSDVVMTWG